MSDTFEKLISDMREMGQLQLGLELDPFANVYAARLEALVAGLTLPQYGADAGEGKWQDAFVEDAPIYREMLGDEPAPGSDWVLVDPVVEDDADLGHYGPPESSTPETDDAVTGDT